MNNVANRLAGRFKFGYHELDDIKQQARLFALEALPNWDGVRPLENFLWTHVKNRLCNFKRDKYERINNPCTTCKYTIYSDIDCNKCELYNDLTECKYYRQWIKRNQCKKNIMNPVGFDNINDENEDNMKLCFNDEIEHNELLDIIDKELPVQLRGLFLRLKFGTKLTKTQKNKIQLAVKEILIKYGYN